MRLRKIPGADEAVQESPYVVGAPENYIGTWNALFRQEAPLYLEIGCGKGHFINEMAALHPDRNYLGIERIPSVLRKAGSCRKRESLFPFRRRGRTYE